MIEKLENKIEKLEKELENYKEKFYNIKTEKSYNYEYKELLNDMLSSVETMMTFYSEVDKDEFIEKKDVVNNFKKFKDYILKFKKSYNL